MGAYVNPPGGNKEGWLAEHGTRVESPSWADKPQDHLPVVLVDNGFFTAAAIAFCEKEFDFFMEDNPRDERPRTWYYVPRTALLEASDLAEYERKLARRAR